MWVLLCVCGLVISVKSHENFQQIQSYPLGASYGSQPIVAQPSTPYHQQYTVQSPITTSHTPATYQDVYLSNFLTHPTIQAFIDPSTKIYNQNGVEISDQIRPRGTANVVNNYFIVPSDYNKPNDTYASKKVPMYGNTKNNDKLTRARTDMDNKLDKVTNSQVNSKPRVKQRHGSIVQDKSNKEYNYKKLVKEDKVIKVDRKSESHKLTKNSNKQHQTEYKINNELQNDEFKQLSPKTQTSDGQKQTIKNRRRKLNKNNTELKNDGTEFNEHGCYELFDINENCCELDCRNVRNSGSKSEIKSSNKRSSQAQNNFMTSWMNYLKTIMPDQNFDSFDYSNMNFPFDFGQMYQMPYFNYGNMPTNRHKKPKRKQPKLVKENEAQPIKESKENAKTTIELHPKFIEIEQKVSNEPKQPSEILLEPNTNIYIEETDSKVKSIEAELENENSSINDNEVIDYYPDFTKDAIYTTDEDDLYFFHNRHYYNTDDRELSRERRKYERDDGKTINDIPSSHKEKIVFEELKFRTPPGLKDPGFQTKKVDINDRYYVNNDEHKIEFKPLKENNNIETVFAHSKVIKYGTQRDIEKKEKLELEKNEKIVKDRKPTLIFPTV